MMALSGCGDDGGGGGGSGATGGTGGSGGSGENLDETISLFCGKIADCYGLGPEYEASCEQTYGAFFDGYTFMEGCEAALLSYTRCYIETPCDDIGAECAEELATLASDCPDVARAFL